MSPNVTAEAQSRFHNCLEQDQWQPETPSLVCANPSGCGTSNELGIRTANPLPVRQGISSTASGRARQELGSRGAPGSTLQTLAALGSSDKKTQETLAPKSASAV